MKLVEPPPPGDEDEFFLARFTVNPDRMKREQHYAKLARQVRDAVEALDGEELADYFAYSDFSQQDITELCRALEQHTRFVAYDDAQAIKQLRALNPSRIWSRR